MPIKLILRTAAALRGAAPPRAETRLEVCPPAAAPRKPLGRLATWLRGPWVEGTDAERLRSDGDEAQLQRARADFVGQLEDIRSRDAEQLCHRVEMATSLRDLWHLRSRLFDLVARQQSQQDAERRLARLNVHFPTRSPRSGLAPLDRLADLDARRR